jgi:hypothetical protein
VVEQGKEQCLRGTAVVVVTQSPWLMKRVWPMTTWLAIPACELPTTSVGQTCESVEGVGTKGFLHHPPGRIRDHPILKSQQLKCDSPDGDRATRPSMGEEIAATGGGAGW